MTSGSIRKHYALNPKNSLNRDHVKGLNAVGGVCTKTVTIG